MPPRDCRVKVVCEFIKHIEANIRHLRPNFRQGVRNHCLQTIERVATGNLPTQHHDRVLKQALNETTRFLTIRDNNNLMITRADKGNVTVVLDNNDYLNKMNTLLSDENTYVVLRKDPTRKITKDLNNLLQSWLKKEFINHQQYALLNCTDGVIPRAYGLPKIHKANCPLRMIVSTVGSPLHSLARFLQDLIHASVPKATSHINNSFELFRKLSGARIDEHFDLISLDVISLFTNIPLDLAIKSISSRWQFLSQNTELPLEEFLAAIQFVFDSTYFIFDGVIYKQTFGSPMGSPLSPVIADLVLVDLEIKALERLPIVVPIYFRYIDDVLMSIPRSLVKTVLEVFNSFHYRLQFTVEVGLNRINFLDTTVIINNGIIEFDWYHKPTFSGRYLSFASHHPDCQKVGTIIGMVDRAFLLSHPRYQQKNIKMLIDILQANGYPLELVFRIVNKRIIKLINEQQRENLMDAHISDSRIKDRFFVIPYIKKITNNLVNTVKKFNLRTAIIGLNKLNWIIKPLKDKLHNNYLSGVVYKICCQNCDASYVGQTKRQVGTRIKEHRNQLSRNPSDLSVVSQHRLEGHEFDWDNVLILDRERSYLRRSISEMFYIKRQNNGINLQEDTAGLSNDYVPVIERLPHC